MREKELNIIIYLIKYNEDGDIYFDDNQYKIFEQLSKYLHQSQFLFVCTKAKEKNDYDQVKKGIKNNFRNMIINGMKKSNLNNDKKSNTKNDNNIIDPLKYLYCLQKKEISYNEINYKDKNEINEEKFNSLNFSEKFDLKFKYYNEKDKNIELVDTIIDQDKTLFFTNLKKDSNHEKIFGINKIINKIIETLEYLKKKNYQFIDNKIKNIQLKIKNENHLNNNSEEDIQLLKDINNINDTYVNLRNSLISNNINQSKDFIEKILKIEKSEATKDLKSCYFYSFISGILPILDMGVEFLVKNKAKEKIAKEFEDTLINFNSKDINLSLKQKEEIKKIKKDINDTPSNIFKTAVKGGAWVFCIAVKTAFGLFRWGTLVVGSIFGMIMNLIVMKQDINALLEFYAKRLKYRYQENLSIKLVIDYFKKLSKEYDEK